MVVVVAAVDARATGSVPLRSAGTATLAGAKRAIAARRSDPPAWEAEVSILIIMHKVLKNAVTRAIIFLNALS